MVEHLSNRSWVLSADQKNGNSDTNPKPGGYKQGGQEFTDHPLHSKFEANLDYIKMLYQKTNTR